MECKQYLIPKENVKMNISVSQGGLGSPGLPGNPGEKGNPVRLVTATKHLPLMHHAAHLFSALLGKPWKSRSYRRDSKIHPQPCLSECFTQCLCWFF